MALLTFEPVYQERLWGGRAIESFPGRTLPPDVSIGESWEVCDRPEAQTRIPEKNATLHELWSSGDRRQFFGSRAPEAERFPLLIKILDARDRLSLQVHPPAERASALNGEPKTECWYFIETETEARIYVGLKKGVDRAAFEKALELGTVAECFHVLDTSPGEVMFLPSGRVHAIGGGNLILEIQQNSDTTYRVYDWDRIDAKTGQARELHVKESLDCINYADIEPTFAQPHGESLIDCIYFKLDRSLFFEKETRHLVVSEESCIYGFNTRGRFRIGEREIERGTSFLLSADSGEVEVACLDDEGELITVTWPE